MLSLTTCGYDYDLDFQWVCIWMDGEIEQFRDISFQTPLHRGCFEGNVEIVRMLLNAGSDVNVENVRLKGKMGVIDRRGSLRI